MEISGIGFENFRVFRDESDFDLAPITILTGANSSGKSTVIKGLKLFQTFWENGKAQYSLDFDEGSHQLGNFEMALSDNSNSNKLILRYYIKSHILFGDLYVENIYTLDENNPMKNGQLLQSSIIQSNTDGFKLLYQTQHENRSFKYYCNKKEVVEVLIPKLKELYEEQKAYHEKVSKYRKYGTNKTHENIGEIENFGDYTGAANYIPPSFDPVENDYFVGEAYPIINQEFCDFLGIDYLRCKALDAFGGVSHIYQNLFDENDVPQVSPIDAKNFDYNCPHMQIMRLIAQISVNEYDIFEDILWALILQQFPELKSRFNSDSFKEIIAGIENNYIEKEKEDLWEHHLVYKGESIWKKVVKERISSNFDAFYMDLKNRVFQENSSSSEDSIFKRSDKTTYYNRWYLNRAFYSNDNQFKLFGGFTGDEDDDTMLFRLIANYVTTIVKKLFDYKGESFFRTTIDLMYKILRTLDYLTYESINKFSKNMFFIESVRANTQRLYTHSSQGTSFNEFLREYMDCNYSDKEKMFLSKWIREFGIGDEAKFDIIPGVGIQIAIIKDNKKINIVDLGYGVTQFLPILMNIIYCAHKGKTNIVIEEPETNLHPKFQSKLADMFVDARKTFFMSFIIETHSEYLIRKFQYLTAKGDIIPEDAVIYYLGSPNPEKRDDGEEQVQKINIKPNGQLTKPFGSGFYDEADNLSLQLLSHFLN